MSGAQPGQHPQIDLWISEVDALLADHRDHSISPSEFGSLPTVGDVRRWTTTADDFGHSIDGLLTRLTRDPGRWVLVAEIDEDHDRFLRAVAYEDGSLLVETMGNRYLHGEYQLTEAQAVRLSSLGWQEPRPDGQATWQMVEATHAPDIERVSAVVRTTLDEVFGCAPSHPIELKLSGLRERGATPASERPYVTEAESPSTLDLGGGLHFVPWPTIPDRTGPVESADAYFEALFPEPTVPVSELSKWKRATTGRNLAQAYWDARERARLGWEAAPHTTGEWALEHPPVVLWVPHYAEAGCLACTWLGGGTTPEGAAERARQHSVDAGDDPSVVRCVSIPISARNRPNDPPLGRRSVPSEESVPPADQLWTGPLWDRSDPNSEECHSSAVVELDPASSHPEAGPTTLFLDVLPNEDLDDEEIGWDAYIWRVTISEDEASFGDAECDSGRANSVDEGELDCWEAVVDLLRINGYRDDEIAGSL